MEETAPPRVDAAPHRLLAEIERHWVALTLVTWLAVTVYFVVARWAAIHWLALGDTDDNMRLMQVRALLNGQGWYDLRQYRMNPPFGFDIHWSRLVDLPIAGLILLLRPFVGVPEAERLACGIAPLIPLSLAMLGTAAAARRLVAPLAWPLALVMLLCAAMTMLMFMPERIDHHGWQLACLAVTVAGLCDARAVRGGVLVGVASAVSLTIGLELMPYAGIAAAVLALRWVWDRAEATRLAAYAASLGGGCALGYAGFASYADRVMRCDAMTPVWLTVMIATGAALTALAVASPARREVRLAVAVVAGGIIAAGFALLFPQCLGRPEQVSPELVRTWLQNVKEAKPIYGVAATVAFPVGVLPVIGLVGAAIAAWRLRTVEWASVLALIGASCLLLLWQIRAGPAAQLLAVPGATMLAWWIVPWLQRQPNMLVRVFGTVGAFLLISGLATGIVIEMLPVEKVKPTQKRANRATAKCTSQPALAVLDRLPAQTVFTFVDFGPRLIAMTHHSAVAGPYHRNGGAILDVQHAFSGSADQARAIMKRHAATLLLTCPGMAESTIYRARNPGGFYDQLAHRKVPAWLQPVGLPANSPFQVWRIN